LINQDAVLQKYCQKLQKVNHLQQKHSVFVANSGVMEVAATASSQRFLVTDSITVPDITSAETQLSSFEIVDLHQPPATGKLCYFEFFSKFFILLLSDYSFS
jgi:hypothetical protein